MSEKGPSGSARARGRAVVALLGLVAVETALLVRQELRIARVEALAADLGTAAELDLNAGSALLLALDGEQAHFDLARLRALRARGHAWVDTYAQGQGLSPDRAVFLHALHDRFLTDYAEARILAELGGYDAQDLPYVEEAVTRRYLTAAGYVLGEERIAGFARDLAEERASW